LSAVLIVTSIAATSVLVRVWPAKTATPPLASRRLPLYATPVLVQPTPVPTATAARTPVRGYAAKVVVRSQPALTAPLIVEPEPAAQAIAPTTGAVPGPAPVDAAAAIERPMETAVAEAIDTVPIVATITPPSPPQASRGLVELPAVAVTRAVIVAGRGIKTGLRATSAVFRAAF
jgi:hypothetical protein